MSAPVRSADELKTIVKKVALFVSNCFLFGFVYFGLAVCTQLWKGDGQYACKIQRNETGQGRLLAHRNSCCGDVEHLALSIPNHFIVFAGGME